MPVRKDYHIVPGSERTQPVKSQLVGEIDPEASLTVTVRVRRPGASSKLRGRTMDLSREAPRHRKYLTRTQFTAKHGADPADLAKIAGFAHEHGLTVVESSRAKRSVNSPGR